MLIFSFRCHSSADVLLMNSFQPGYTSTTFLHQYKQLIAILPPPKSHLQIHYGGSRVRRLTLIPAIRMY